MVKKIYKKVKRCYLNLLIKCANRVEFKISSPKLKIKTHLFYSIFLVKSVHFET